MAPQGTTLFAALASIASMKMWYGAGLAKADESPRPDEVTSTAPTAEAYAQLKLRLVAANVVEQRDKKEKECREKKAQLVKRFGHNETISCLPCESSTLSTLVMIGNQDKKDMDDAFWRFRQRDRLAELMGQPDNPGLQALYSHIAAYYGLVEGCTVSAADNSGRVSQVYVFASSWPTDAS